MVEKIKIPKRISTALINSLTAGVVPRIGLEHIAVGRKREIEAILNDLENVSEGGASFCFIVGRYGSGKSFLMQIIRNNAMERDFVVADADLSPERRLVGTKGQGLSTYRELMHRVLYYTLRLNSREKFPWGGCLGCASSRNSNVILNGR